jgi:hypothetical protein
MLHLYQFVGFQRDFNLIVTECDQVARKALVRTFAAPFGLSQSQRQPGYPALNRQPTQVKPKIPG